MDLLTVAIIAIILLFPFLLIIEARKQKKASTSLFENYALSHGWTYRQEDDGTIQQLTKGFQGLGRFHSPSLGKVSPENVVIGSVSEGRIYFYQHHVRIYEGNAFQFNVCLLQLKNSICDSLIIRFKKGKSRLTNDLYTMPELAIDPKWSKDVVIYGNDPDIKNILNNSTLTKLIQKANTLPWRTDMQIKGNLVAVYIAERNRSIDNESDFDTLMDFAKYVVATI